MINLSEPLRLSETYQEGKRDTETEGPTSDRYAKSGLPISKQTHAGMSSFVQSQNMISEKD